LIAGIRRIVWRRRKGQNAPGAVLEAVGREIAHSASDPGGNPARGEGEREQALRCQLEKGNKTANLDLDTSQNGPDMCIVVRNHEEVNSDPRSATNNHLCSETKWGERGELTSKGPSKLRSLNFRSLKQCGQRTSTAGGEKT